MEALRETLIVAEQDLRHSVRTTKALAFLIIYALLTLGAGGAVIWSVAGVQKFVAEQVEKLPPGMAPEDIEAQKTKAYNEAVKWLIDDDEQAEYLISIPVLILFFFWMTRYFFPWLVVLMTYDQIAGELHNRSARYQLLRCRRGSLLAGKILANLVLLAILTAITNLVLIGVATWKIPDFELGAAVVSLFRFWLLFLPLALAHIGLMAMISSLFRTPYLSMLLGMSVLMITGMLRLLAGTWATIEPIRWAIPWNYGPFLISHRLEDQLIGAGAYLGFSLLFIGAAWVILRRRDV